MAAVWPFFDDFIGKVEMVCAKADLEIAEMYVRHLGGDMALFEELKGEYHRTVDALFRIRQASRLLTNHPVLQEAVDHRNPYVDPLSLIQIELLARRGRLDPDDPQQRLMDQAIGTTLNGVAQGMRNTG
jgi:phosphoenolpyruvate carboxylase